MTDMFSNKVALVTGAASGMGLATARAFAEAGAAVVLADYRQDQVDAEAKKLTTAGYKAIALGCDVGDDAQVAAMVDSTVAHFGRLGGRHTCELLIENPLRRTRPWWLRLPAVDDLEPRGQFKQ